MSENWKQPKLSGDRFTPLLNAQAREILKALALWCRFGGFLVTMKKKSVDWKSLLKADPTDWLLEKDNPSVRYFTLKDILGRDENDPEVKNARKEIIESGIMPRSWKNRTTTAVGEYRQIFTFAQNIKVRSGTSFYLQNWAQMVMTVASEKQGNLFWQIHRTDKAAVLHINAVKTEVSTTK